MAEAVAAFQVVETAVEGAAVGAIATAQPTVPIVIRFHKIKSPSPKLTLSSHSLNYYKGRAYIFGGDHPDGPTDNTMHVITLPSDLALNDIDYRAVEAVAEPTRPLAEYTDSNVPTSKEAINHPPAPRTAHASTTIDATIFIFGGRSPTTSTPAKPPSILDESGTIHAFSPLTNRWTTLTPNQPLCASGVPQPRVYASMGSTPHPSPSSSLQATTEAHGTLFLHGGYAADGGVLRDTWTFDVSSNVWARWPDLPVDDGGSRNGDGDGEGKILCEESRLWHVGGSRGRVAYLDVARGVVDDFSGKGEIGVSPRSGTWEMVNAAAVAGDTAAFPSSRKGGGFVPVTSGAGREFLLYFFGESTRTDSTVLSDVWTFQIASQKKSPAVVKDKIRGLVGADTGEHRWARCDVVEASKSEGNVERPEGGLGRFAADAWRDLGGGAVVVWGGKVGGEVKGEGWVVTVD